MHPAERFEPEVALVARRAKITSGLLLAGLVVDVGDFVGREGSLLLLDQGATQETLETADAVVTGLATLEVALFLLTGIFFLMWIHRLVHLTRMIANGLRWTASEAVWGFIIPFVSLIRPFQVVRDVQKQLDFAGLPEPAPQPSRTEAMGYRTMTFDAPPPATPLPVAFFGWWWGFFVAMNLLGRMHSHSAKWDPVNAYHFAAFDDVIRIAAAWFAIKVVRNLTARLQEHYRRVRFASEATLEEHGLILG